MIVDADLRLAVEALRRGECLKNDPDTFEACGYGSYCSKACELRDEVDKLTEALRLAVKIGRRTAIFAKTPGLVHEAADSVIAQFDRLTELYLK